MTLKLKSRKYAKKHKCIKCQAWRRCRHNASAVVCTELSKSLLSKPPTHAAEYVLRVVDVDREVEEQQT